MVCENCRLSLRKAQRFICSVVLQHWGVVLRLVIPSASLILDPGEYYDPQKLARRQLDVVGELSEKRL